MSGVLVISLESRFHLCVCRAWTRDREIPELGTNDKASSCGLYYRQAFTLIAADTTAGNHSVS